MVRVTNYLFRFYFKWQNIIRLLLYFLTKLTALALKEVKMSINLLEKLKRSCWFKWMVLGPLLMKFLSLLQQIDLGILMKHLEEDYRKEYVHNILFLDIPLPGA